MSHEVLNEALAAPGSNGTCTVSYSGLLYHSTYMPISRAAVRKSDPDTSFLDTSCLSTLYGVPVLRSRTRTNAADDIRHRYSPLAYFCFFFSLFCILIFFFFFYTPQKKRRKSEQKDSTTNTMSAFVAETILASKTLQTLRKFSVIKLRYSHRQTVAIYANSHFSENKLKK